MAARRWSGPAGASRGRWIASEPIRLPRDRQAGTGAREARSAGACAHGRICIRVVAAAIIGRSLAGWRAHRMRARPNARLRTSRARGRILTTYSVSQAAAAVGRDRSSIRRAITRGAISAVRDAASGEWRIDPAELHRVYPPAHAPSADRDDAPLRPTDADARLAIAEARFADAQETIADLRRRLDVATEQLGEAL